MVWELIGAVLLAATASNNVPQEPTAPNLAALPQIEAAPYAPRELCKGKLNIAGSRTMAQAAVLWSDGFCHLHPDVKADFEFKGSETALEHLAANPATVGLLSRSLSESDQKAFAEKHPGLKLLDVHATLGAVAVIVHPDNPLPAVSLRELKLLFGKADQAEGQTWASVGLPGEWAKTPVKRIVPDSKSGTRSQFIATVLGPGGKLAPATEFSWHQAIVDEVAKNPSAIGLVSYANAHATNVRIVPVASEPGAAAVFPSPEAISAGDYPLVRPLSVVVAARDGQIVDPLAAEFIRYVLSENGQNDVVKDGLQPLGRDRLLQQYDRLDWHQMK